LLIITISGVVLSELPYKQPTGLLLVWFMGMYLVSRKIGPGITRFFGLATVVGCLGIIVYSVTHNFVRTGGLIHTTNYNIASAAIVTGFLLWESKYKWALSALVLVSLFFTGANEALVAVTALILALLIRRDWSKKLLLPVGALVVTLIICTPLGITQTIWSVTSTRVEAGVSTIESPSQPSEEPILDSSLDTATGSRWSVYKKAFSELEIIGHGYAPFDDLGTSIHNVPLRVAYELGIPIAIVWLIVYFYALRKSKAKYALVALGAFSLFDNMFWTQIPAYFWVGLGLCLTASAPDYLFKSLPEQSASKSEVSAAAQAV
jgi:hypothetical protein